MANTYETLRWEDDRFYLIDQTRLPVEQVVEEQESVTDVWESIKALKVRGAPAIGVAGAYGLAVAMREHRGADRATFLARMREAADYLDSSRPTAVNLHWALERVVAEVTAAADSGSGDLYARLLSAAEAIHREDIDLCDRLGANGADLIAEGAGVLTHCNAGRLATTGIGTATAPMYVAHRRGVSFTVYSDESRPLLQGSRLTAWELKQAGLDVVTITDSMAAFVMEKGLIQLVLVGADRIAANGDAANKIGTMGVAILARHFNIPFYVVAPFSTVDMNTPDGASIVIEERDAEEVTHFGLRRTAPEGIRVRNPAFDVTPHDLIAGIITDREIVRPPYGERLTELFG